MFFDLLVLKTGVNKRHRARDRACDRGRGLRGRKKQRCCWFSCFSHQFSFLMAEKKGMEPVNRKVGENNNMQDVRDFVSYKRRY